jgi:hypothetical protein
MHEWENHILWKVQEEAWNIGNESEYGKGKVVSVLN